MTLQVLLRQIHRRWDDRIAVVDGSLELTFREMLDYALQAAATLKQSTGKQKPRIAALLGNRWEYVVLDLACAYSGCALVRLNARDTAADIAFILEDAQADCFIYSADFEKVAVAASQLISRATPTIRLPAGEASERRAGFEAELCSSGTDVPPSLLPGDIYKILYTSGTTGKPKGIIVTHEQWKTAVIQNLFTGPLLDVRADSAFLHVTPMTHISGGLMWPFMIRGGRQVISPDTSLQTIAAEIGRTGVTHTFLVPTLVTRMANATEEQRANLLKLERVYYAGSPIGAQSLKQVVDIYGAIFAQGYGSTEAMWWLTYYSPEEHAKALDAGNIERLSSCGQPSFGVEIAIVDEEGRPVQQGQVGEFATRGAHVARSYVNGNDVPRDPRIGPDWYRTGDMGYEDADGFFYPVDRKNNLIITGGFNVYPGEVETVLMNHSAIAECCVLGSPDEQWGETITAFIVKARDSNLTEQDVDAYARSNLADYRRPRKIFFVEELPVNAAGKINRGALREKLWQGQARNIG